MFGFGEEFEPQHLEDQDSRKIQNYFFNDEEPEPEQDVYHPRETPVPSAPKINRAFYEIPEPNRPSKKNKGSSKKKESEWIFDLEDEDTEIISMDDIRR